MVTRQKHAAYFTTCLCSQTSRVICFSVPENYREEQIPPTFKVRFTPICSWGSVRWLTRHLTTTLMSSISIFYLPKLYLFKTLLRRTALWQAGVARSVVQDNFTSIELVWLGKRTGVPFPLENFGTVFQSFGCQSVPFITSMSTSSLSSLLG